MEPSSDLRPSLTSDDMVRRLADPQLRKELVEYMDHGGSVAPEVAATARWLKERLPADRETAASDNCGGATVASMNCGGGGHS